DRQVDVVQQLELLAAVAADDLLDLARFQAQAEAAVEGVDDAFVQREEEGADADALALPDDAPFLQAAAVHENAVAAVKVGEQQAAVEQPFELGVPPRDGRVGQQDVAVGRAADD